MKPTSYYHQTKLADTYDGGSGEKTMPQTADVTVTVNGYVKNQPAWEARVEIRAQMHPSADAAKKALIDSLRAIADDLETQKM